jgi:glycosyltransferase involved in cell wall biosynthesis
MDYLREAPNSVSVIILTRNQRKFLEKCLDSILNQSLKPCQIIVVDNGTSDDTVDFLKNCGLNNLEIIENNYNLGFGKAMNNGIKRANGYYTLLLADDIVIEPDCLISFLSYIKKEDNIGLLSGYIYNYYNKELIFSGQKINLGWNFKQNKITANNSIKQTDLIPGAFIFAKTALLKQFRGFDERYFAYLEDLDLTLRFKEAGFRNLLIPWVRAYHLEEGLGIKKYETDKKIQFELVKNVLITYFKHAKLFWLILFFIRYMFFGFIKNVFDANRRRATLKTRWWALCNLINLIKARHYGYNSSMVNPHIIYFQQNLAIGATEEYLYLLIDGVDKSRFHLTFVCPKDSILDPLVVKLEKIGIVVYRYLLCPNHAILIWWLRELFLNLKPDLVHFNDPCLSGIIAARLARVPVLLMTHHTPELNRIYSWKARLLEKIAFRYSGLYVIFTSEYDRETGINKDKIAQDRSFVIYYGLPPKKFSPRYNKKEIYDEFSVDEECHIIGNIARLSPQKGQNYLIEAASLVIEQFKSVKFFFVGDGKLESELKTQVQERGLQNYFIFTGYRTDIPRILSAFEMLVMPSLFEGLCFAVIEASAMGIPVIATAVGGMRRSVVDGKNGLLIPPADSQALAKAVLWMLGHPREAKEMGLAGRRLFEELFTQEQMVKKTERLYNSLLAKDHVKRLNQS